MDHIGTDDIAKLKHENRMYVYLMEHKSPYLQKRFTRYVKMLLSV